MIISSTAQVELPDLRSMEQSEARIMQAAREDISRFAPIYERYFSRVYTYCLRRVENPQEAEDLTSLIFTQAMTRLDQYRGGLVAAWLFRIAHNAVIDHLRKHRPDAPLDEVISETPGLLEHMIQAEQVQEIRALIADLPDDQQNLLLLKIVAGLSSKEVGAMLGKTAGSVRVALHRILRELYQQMEGTHDHTK
jgi:RNA polymerase sigma-70 factor, ECF subfamily